MSENEKAKKEIKAIEAISLFYLPAYYAKVANKSQSGTDTLVSVCIYRLQLLADFLFIRIAILYSARICFYYFTGFDYITAELVSTF